MSDKVFIYEKCDPEIQIISGEDSLLKIYGEDSVVRIYEPGPQGRPGDQGPPGFSGAGEPFFVVQQGILYASTASIAVNAFISSSLTPWSGGFDLGTTANPWKTVYVSESIFIIKNGATLVQLRGSENTLEIGQSKITTSSFGFEQQVITRISSNHQTFRIQSASYSSSIDATGIFSVADFQYLPEPVSGGIIKSGSNFFFGI